MHSGVIVMMSCERPLILRFACGFLDGGVEDVIAVVDAVRQRQADQDGEQDINGKDGAKTAPMVIVEKKQPDAADGLDHDPQHPRKRQWTANGK